MFEKLRQSLRDAMSGQAMPARVAMMRDALVEAKVGLSQVRDARDGTRALLERERAELATVQRRRALAEQIGDRETVEVAQRFERRHGERVGVLERKLAAQEEELGLAEREVEEMSSQLKAMAAGIDPSAAAPSAGARPADAGASEADFDALRRAAERNLRDQDAERRLAELKRRMGK
jgi:hypothetical protein